jgi:hypothetical protein
MMTSARFLTAMVLAACALAASVLVAIPTDSTDSLDSDTLSPSYTSTVPPVAGTTGQTATKPTTRSLQPADESHVALPRIWLGSPIAR